MRRCLEGTVAAISGGGRGLGLARPRLFAREDASVVIRQRDRPEGEQAVTNLHAEGGRVCFAARDVTQEDSWRHVIHTALETLGRLDILVNNAEVLLPPCAKQPAGQRPSSPWSHRAAGRSRLWHAVSGVRRSRVCDRHRTGHRWRIHGTVSGSMVVQPDALFP